MKRKEPVFTIPNLLTAVRLLLIPVIVWLYCFRKEYCWAAAVLTLSGITDIADGWIARHFDMVSDLGKIIDPIADKLTQGVTLLCLGTRYPFMLLLGILLAVKEITSGLHALHVVRKTQTVIGADWHGKAVTCLLYLTMAIHILWVNVPRTVSIVSASLCFIMMAISFTLYLRRNCMQMKNARKENTYE